MEEDVELLDIHLPLKTLFHLGDENLSDVFLGEAHPKQAKLGHVGNLVPTLVHKLAL